MNETHQPPTETSGQPLNVASIVESIIVGRRTIKIFNDRAVPRDLVAHLIAASVWAPNHRLTEPWRFYVIDGLGRERVGAIAAEIARQKARAAGATDSLAVERKAQETARTWASVPVLLFVTFQGDQKPDVDRENYGATCCAIQNLSLLAHAHGLGTSWSSGAVAAAPEMLVLVGARDKERMAGLIRLGYPEQNTRPTTQRTSGTVFTTWLDA